ncbi:hypothetical protein BGX21_003616 [Mortierella sp. AD011]|nr:hypothetical protein BGX21_003616 [Mortierella sp. AD011]
MEHAVEFAFTGAMKCKLLFCTNGTFLCGCDTCKFWLKYETIIFSDEKNATFGYIQFKGSPNTQAFDICSHHAMHMNLVPFDDTTSRNAKDLDLMAATSVTKTTNKLQLDFRGTKECKMVFTAAINCGCESCKWWEQWAKGTFSDNSDFKYGPETKTFDLCPHHVMALNLTSFDDNTVRNAADLDVFISGDDIRGVWEDELEIEDEMNNITVKVYAADTTNNSRYNKHYNYNSHRNNHNVAYQRALRAQNMRIRRMHAQRARCDAMNEVE